MEKYIEELKNMSYLITEQWILSVLYFLAKNDSNNILK